MDDEQRQAMKVCLIDRDSARALGFDASNSSAGQGGVDSLSVEAATEIRTLALFAYVRSIFTSLDFKADVEGDANRQALAAFLQLAATGGDGQFAAFFDFIDTHKAALKLNELQCQNFRGAFSANQCDPILRDFPNNVVKHIFQGMLAEINDFDQLFQLAKFTGSESQDSLKLLGRLLAADDKLGTRLGKDCFVRLNLIVCIQERAAELVLRNADLKAEGVSENFRGIICADKVGLLHYYINELASGDGAKALCPQRPNLQFTDDFFAQLKQMAFDKYFNAQIAGLGEQQVAVLERYVNAEFKPADVDAAKQRYDKIGKEGQEALFGQDFNVEVFTEEQLDNLYVKCFAKLEELKPPVENVKVSKDDNVTVTEKVEPITEDKKHTEFSYQAQGFQEAMELAKSPDYLGEMTIDEPETTGEVTKTVVHLTSEEFKGTTLTHCSKNNDDATLSVTGDIEKMAKVLARAVKADMIKHGVLTEAGILAEGYTALKISPSDLTVTDTDAVAFSQKLDAAFIQELGAAYAGGSVIKPQASVPKAPNAQGLFGVPKAGSDSETTSSENVNTLGGK